MEQLLLALVLSAGMCVRFYWRMRKAEREATRLTREICHYRAHASESEQKYLAAHFKWLDMKSRYLDALDENAFLRSGGAAE